MFAQGVWLRTDEGWGGEGEMLTKIARARAGRARVAPAEAEVPGRDYGLGRDQEEEAPAHRLGRRRGGVVGEGRAGARARAGEAGRGVGPGAGEVGARERQLAGRGEGEEPV